MVLLLSTAMHNSNLLLTHLKVQIFRSQLHLLLVVGTVLLTTHISWHLCELNVLKPFLKR